MCIRDRCYVPEVYYTQSHRQRLARVVPGEGGRVLVVALDVVHDLLDELLLGGPHAASHHLPRKDVEEDLHLVQPGGVGGRMQDRQAPPLRRPLPDVLGLVHREVVADHVELLAGVLAVERLEKGEEGDVIVLVAAVRIPPKANTLSAPSRTPVPLKPNTIGAKRRVCSCDAYVLFGFRSTRGRLTAFSCAMILLSDLSSLPCEGAGPAVRQRCSDRRPGGAIWRPAAGLRRSSSAAQRGRRRRP